MIQKHFANLIPLFLMATALGTAFGQQATFYPSKDTSIYQESENSNALGTGLYVGKNTQDNLRRALLAFDLTSIPQGSTITSVTLQMKVTRANGQTGPIVVAVHRVTRDWGEGTSLAPGEGGQGGAPTVTDATWNHALYPNSNWAAEGGDYTESPSETTVVGVTDTTPVWTGTSELIADVQGWVNNPASNFGWILIGGEGTTGGAKRLGSREAETIEARPRLLIEYEEAVIPDTIYFPQFGNGTGFFSQITLSSIDSDEVTSAVVSLRDGAGNPLDTVLNGQPTVDGELSINVPAGGSVVLQSDATGDIKTGSVTVTSDRPLFGVIVFGGSFGLAGVGSSEHPSNNLVGPVEVSESGQINTG
ncbi:MAG: DNRLRE domain-containing protein, partial [Acidobacteriota bacterium]